MDAILRMDTVNSLANAGKGNNNKFLFLNSDWWHDCLTLFPLFDKNRCRFGFRGDNCSDCSTMPGCQRGSCEQPLDCNCDVGWKGLFCSIRKSMIFLWGFFDKRRQFHCLSSFPPCINLVKSYPDVPWHYFSLQSVFFTSFFSCLSLFTLFHQLFSGRHRNSSLHFAFSSQSSSVSCLPQERNTSLESSDKKECTSRSSYNSFFLFRTRVNASLTHGWRKKMKGRQT